MRFQARIEHVLLTDLVGKPCRDCAAVAVVPLHAQMQRLGTAQDEPGVHRARYGAGRVQNELQAGREIVVIDECDSADHVAVAVEILCGRMPHDVGAELERLLEVWRREGVVDDEERVMQVGDIRRGARSVSRMSGLVGVSTIMAAVALVHASAISCGSRVSTYVNVIP